MKTKMHNQLLKIEKEIRCYLLNNLYFCTELRKERYIKIFDIKYYDPFLILDRDKNELINNFEEENYYEPGKEIYLEHYYDYLQYDWKEIK